MDPESSTLQDVVCCHPFLETRRTTLAEEDEKTTRLDEKERQCRDGAVQGVAPKRTSCVRKELFLLRILVKKSRADALEHFTICLSSNDLAQVKIYWLMGWVELDCCQQWCTKSRLNGGHASW